MWMGVNIMNKQIKLFIIIAFVSAFTILLSPYEAQAASYGICMTGVKYQQDSKTGTISKTQGGSHFVQINKASTSLTNPCPDCEIRVRPHKVNVGTLGGRVIKMSKKPYEISPSDGSGEAGYNYYLKVARYNYTLLDTTVDLTWYYQGYTGDSI